MITPDSTTAFTETIAQASGAFRAFLRQRFRECGLDLTTEMVQVLYYLWGCENVNQQEIANAINRDKASLTPLLDNLVRRELVQRREDPQDRRNKRIVLTAKGRALESQVRGLLREMHEAACTDLTPTQLSYCQDILAQITHSLQQARR